MVNLSGGTNYLAGDVLGTLTLSSGTLAGSGDLTVRGTLNWTGGTMSGAGKTVIAAGGALNINAGGSTVTLARVLENNGTANWTSGVLYFSVGTINNNGSFTASSSSGLTAFGINGSGTNAFNNAGTFTNAGGGTSFTTSSTGVAFNNTGTVAVLAGSLSLSAGGTHTGTFSAAAATSITLSGNHTFQTSNTFAGSGAMNLAGGTYSLTGDLLGTLALSSGTLTVTSAVNANNFTMSGGTLTGGADFTVTGTLNWTGGTMSGAGKTVIAAGGALNINAGGSTVTLARVLENNGTANWTSGVLYFSVGTINNNGSFTASSSSGLTAFGINGSGTNAFNNAGTFTNAGGGTSFTTSSTGVAFNNTGTVQVQAGSVGCVSYTQTAGTTNLNGGTLSSSNTININGGILSGTGTVSASVSNGGQVSPGASPGTLTIGGNYTQTSTGALNIEIGGVAAGSEFDRLIVTGLATLGGTVRVQLLNGYQPPLAQTFLPVTFGSRSGMFSLLDAPVFGDDLTFNTSWTATTFSLAVVRTAFGSWKQTKFGADAANPAIAGAMSDPNHNGTPNLLEFAFGMEPLLAGQMNKLPGATQVTVAAQDYPAIRFRRLTGATPGVSYTVQESTNLTGWLPVDLATCQVGAAVDNGDGTETVNVRSTVPMHGLASPGKAFLRVEVSAD